MLRLTKAITATALGLMISLSLFAPSAFAQSADPSPVNHPIVTQGTNFSGDRGHDNPGYNDNRDYRGGSNNDNNDYRPGYGGRCVRVSRWVRTRYGWRRIWYRSCRRY